MTLASLTQFFALTQLSCLSLLFSSSFLRDQKDFVVFVEEEQVALFLQDEMVLFELGEVALFVLEEEAVFGQEEAALSQVVAQAVAF